MIEFTKSFKVGDKVFGTIDEAQAEELNNLLNTFPANVEITTDMQLMKMRAINAVIENRDAVVDILSTTPSSRPKARKANGGTKKRKAPAVIPSDVHP